jgi:hypothetical protein
MSNHLDIIDYYPSVDEDCTADVDNYFGRIYITHEIYQAVSLSNFERHHVERIQTRI